MTHQREIELVLLGCILSSGTFAKQAFASGLPATEHDIIDVLRELSAGGVGSHTTRWMESHGVKITGRVADSLLAEVVVRTERRRLEGLATRLSLSLAAGCQEEVESCLEALKAAK